MWFGSFFFWIVFFPVILIAGIFLFFIVYAATGMSFLDFLAVMFDTGTKLTCWHCGRETPCDRKHCKHCGKELQ